MQILGNMFNIIIFMGSIGNLFTVMLLFMQRVLRFSLHLWNGVLGAVFYLVPIVVPQIKLVSPEVNIWIQSYEIAGVIWVVGAGVFLVYYLLRGLFAHRAIKSYSECEDARLIKIYSDCANHLNIAAMPQLLFGTLKDPACVVTIFRPTVILNREIALQLSDKELQVVLCHELTHIKRKHHLWQRIYDIISVLYWFNPIVWIAKYEFACTCEMDCDQNALKLLPTQTTVKEYTNAMLCLMELSSEVSNKSFGKIGVLSFFMVKQRFLNILNKPSRKRRIAVFIVVVVCVVFTVMLSASVSRSMFYPYPAYSNGNYEHTETTSE